MIAPGRIPRLGNRDHVGILHMAFLLIRLTPSEAFATLINSCILIYRFYNNWLARQCRKGSDFCLRYGVPLSNTLTEANVVEAMPGQTSEYVRRKTSPYSRRLRKRALL